LLLRGRSCSTRFSRSRFRWVSLTAEPGGLMDASVPHTAIVSDFVEGDDDAGDLDSERARDRTRINSATIHLDIDKTTPLSISTSTPRRCVDCLCDRWQSVRSGATRTSGSSSTKTTSWRISRLATTSRTG
jgi:hypothetical protein